MLYKQYLLCCVCYDRLKQGLSDKKSRLKNLCYINNTFYAAQTTTGCNKGYQMHVKNLLSKQYLLRRVCYDRLQ